ncbi:uncharacterized protein LOC116258020 [Nymphaea colorata]|uniref:uncharacterized protein LOC116258020 n=1 Tax=Nymphaea colorata TaxID=210225 RepID=UPI00129D8090|nr:uncharacterized protein LOC116258020 [Nymphaea colorata]XP_031490937.1 uncharacterized protein LOC116258020 [Nymphaea colorata]XP_031490938.1 uncharacterized protein LOC116258020 [Nymphaea colorata]
METSGVSVSSSVSASRPPPKRFVRQQVPDSILNDPALKAAMSLLPSNYNLEVPKCIWRIRQSGAKRVALQFPEGLLMYSLVICDILEAFSDVQECFVLGDVTYGACCIDDFSASALGAELLIHYGHSCLVPIDVTSIPCLYVFVDIQIDVKHLVDTVKNQFAPHMKLAMAGTIQFSSAIHAAKAALESDADADACRQIIVPQSKPLSSGEVLGCTSPSLPKGSVDAVVFVADGRFHLEAFMIANPEVEAYRYDPYLKVLFLEKYDHNGMKEARKKAILQARGSRVWGVVLGTLGHQGNPRTLEHVQRRLAEKGYVSMLVLLSEVTPSKIALFEDSIDAWIQIACPRLSIDWGESFTKPLLTPFEAEVALGFVHPWWEKKTSSVGKECKVDSCNECLPCGKTSGVCADEASKTVLQREEPQKQGENHVNDYPMDYYAQDGGPWNSSYARKKAAQARLNKLSTSGGTVTL